jgi:hypothetical protein
VRHYLTTAAKLDPYKAQAIGERWNDTYGHPAAAGKTAVLEQGLELKQVRLAIWRSFS